MSETPENKAPDLEAMLAQHVDEFIQYGPLDGAKNLGDVDFARWMLHHFRLSATLRILFDKFIQPKKLFCTYEGTRYRCIGASRMGDVWLTTKHGENVGYEKRVDITQCTDWGDDIV